MSDETPRMYTGIISPFSFNAKVINPNNNMGFCMQSTRHFCTWGLRLFIVNAQGIKVRTHIWHASLHRESKAKAGCDGSFVRTRPFNGHDQETQQHGNLPRALAKLQTSLCSRSRFIKAIEESIRLGLWVILKECPVPAAWAQIGSQEYFCMLIKPGRS